MGHKAYWKQFDLPRPRLFPTTITADGTIWDPVKDIAKQAGDKKAWQVLMIMAYDWMRERELIPEDGVYEIWRTSLSGIAPPTQTKRVIDWTK